MTTTATRPFGVDPARLGQLITPDPETLHDYLEIRGLHVTFDGFVAVKDVDLTVTRGDLRFLIGPNGAGKTTVIDAITGLVPATGNATFGLQELLGRPVHRIARLGVGRTFQTASVIEELDVLGNLDLAAGATRSAVSRLRARRTVPARVTEALEAIGLADQRFRTAGALAHGQKQWLEVGMLLVQGARLLLLDEPVAGMSQAEREQTAELLRAIAPHRVVVVVEHDMDFLRAVADSVTVLAAGEVLAEGSVSEIQNDPRVQEIYLGTPVREGGR